MHLSSHVTTRHSFTRGKTPHLVASQNLNCIYFVKCEYVYSYYNNLGWDRFRVPLGGNLILFLSLQKGVEPRVLNIKSSAIS